jgi:2-oxoglutarate dehydrogenase E1 component
MSFWQEFHGPNAGYIFELYERFRQDPGSVDATTRAYFEHWQPPLDELPPSANGAAPAVAVVPQAAAQNVDKVMGVVNLAGAIREYGHLAAQIDPLNLSNPPGDPSLSPETYGLSEGDLYQLPSSLVGGPLSEGKATAYEAIAALRSVYSSTTGYDYDHLRLPDEREWLRHAAESGRFRPPRQAIDSLALLERLSEVEAFELFLHRIFPGKTRFSIEGLDMMVPMLDVIVGGAAENGISTILIGMAHRGRLNVLAHVLCKPYAQILAEFRDSTGSDSPAREYLGWTGDVKYHAGARYELDEDNDQVVDVVISMAPNPSHLEHVNPVVAGMARAAGTHCDRPGRPHFDHKVVLPVIIHGDASFPAQGVVAETLNLQRLRGYRIGGTIHVIANNQIGFTTSQWEGRSTLYASDLAKGFKMPIVHVNADDPEACIEAARLAFAYRHEFQSDFVVDLVGYRRYGHNEGDEPRFTQPRMYQVIDQHPGVRQLWAETLADQGEITKEQADSLLQAQFDKLNEVYQSLPPGLPATLEPQLEPPPGGAARSVQTAVPAEKIIELNDALLALPEGFDPGSKLLRAIKRRHGILEDPQAATVDWATAESLAMASILADDVPIRMTGEDVERGTFSHRHALLRDETSGAIYIPLQNIPQARAAFEIRNSPLSENAAIGFEYGYNIQAPDRLVIWEAQYGDFINGAQAMIDEFVISGRAKWEQTPSLVLLLPHGYEGQGPDHSTGRLERFLQLAAETNIRVANPTTAAQYFHLLRRQAALLETDPLPLIVLTPKSLLRHPQVYSSLNDLSKGRWQPVIDDPQTGETPNAVERLILCSGKVFVDLVSEKRREDNKRVAIVRVEQLYRLPTFELEEILNHYAKIREVVWLQEEPENAGAWEFVQPRLRKLIDGRYPLRLIGRPRRASPAEGSASTHSRNQATLIERAYDFSD